MKVGFPDGKMLEHNMCQIAENALLLWCFDIVLTIAFDG